MWLHLGVDDWAFLADKVRQDELYTPHRISKGKGKGTRTIHEPCPELKRVQMAILRRMLEPTSVHHVRHGNQRGGSIVTNARMHLGNPHVFSVDIQNAFPSVKRSRVRSNLRKPFNHGLKQFRGVEFSNEDREAMLEAIVDIVTWQDKLPQGAPTSPRLLDIVSFDMDADLWQLCFEHCGIMRTMVYTAYVDDLVISSDEPISEEFRGRVLQIIRDKGFVPHTRPGKMEYFSPENGKVPVVTGIMVLPDGRIGIHPEKRKEIRSTLHELLQLPEWDDAAVGTVAGLIGYIRSVYGDNALPSDIRSLTHQARERHMAIAA
jgi:hypothetical protein